MLARTGVSVALLSVAAQVAIATPPACMLAAINTQPDPSDLNTICSGSALNEVAQYICKHCNDNTDTAVDDFASVCSGAGVQVSNDAASCFSNVSSGGGSGSGSPTQSGSGSATGTGSGSSTTTSGVAARSELDGISLGVLGILGWLFAL